MFKNYFFSNLSTTNANYLFVNDTFLGANKKIKDMEVLSEPWFVFRKINNTKKWAMPCALYRFEKTKRFYYHKEIISFNLNELYHLKKINYFAK